MKTILFASSNKSKLLQFQYVADSYGFPVKIVSVYERNPKLKSYSEDYKTQQEIIEKGSLEIYQQVKKPVVVEDSILEVDYLKNKPGLSSSSYLKKYGRAGLIKTLQKVKNREARIISIVGYFNGHIWISFKNVVQGTISEIESFKEGEPHWVGPTHHPLGGGYNSIFIPSGLTTTFADLTAKEGLKLGYREPNLKALLEYLSDELKG